MSLSYYSAIDPGNPPHFIEAPTSSQDELCNLCKEVDIKELFYQPEAYIWDDGAVGPGERTLKHIQEHQQCPICRITLAAFHGFDLGSNGNWTRIHSVVIGTGELRLYENNSYQSIDLARPLCQMWFTDKIKRLDRATDDYEWMPGESFIVHLLHGDLNASESWKKRASQNHGHARLITNYIPSTLVQCWLQYCERHHPYHGSNSTTIHSPQDRGPPFIRLIDVESNQIVEANTNLRYLALSYVWGTLKFATLNQTNLAQLSKPNGLSSIDIPQTISDAMTLCKHLGEKYLWVDSFCIIQDNEEDKVLQIGYMEIIFQKAVMTIANVSKDNNSAHQPLPGVRPNTRLPFQQLHLVQGERVIVSRTYPQSKIKQPSQWATRAWTLQEEYLSTRILYIADTHCWFQCCHGCYFSEEIFLESVIDAGEECVYPFAPNKSHTTSPEGNSRSQEPKAMWIESSRHSKAEMTQVPRGLMGIFKLIEDYTRRQLNFQRDTLRAIDGLLRKAAILDYGLETTYHYGIPVAAFDYALCWIEDEHDPTRRRPEFPSWSWAGWQVAVKFPMGRPSFTAVGITSPAMSICTNAVLEPDAKALDIHLLGKENAKPNDFSLFMCKPVQNRDFDELTAFYGLSVSPRAAVGMRNGASGTHNTSGLDEKNPSLIFYTTYAKLRVDAVPMSSYWDSQIGGSLYAMRSPSNDQIKLGAIRLNTQWRDDQPEILDLDFIVIRSTPSEEFEPFWHLSMRPKPSEAPKPPDWKVSLMCIAWIDEEAASSKARKAERVTMAMMQGWRDYTRMNKDEEKHDILPIPSVKDWMSVEPKPIEVLVELI
ncbi:hypothetical protein AAE478_004150 [Parahypoxylon ruwenzoriense]